MTKAERIPTRFLAIALLALLVRLAPLLRSGTDWALKPDSTGYVQLANGLRAGCGFAQLVDGACASPELLRTPGYPLFLALARSLRLTIFAQAVMGGIICLLTASFVGSRWGASAGIAAGLLLTLDVPSILHSAYILSDSLFSALLLVAIVVQLTAISRASLGCRAIALAMLAALVLGAAAFVRPIGLPLLLFAPVPFLVVPGVSWRKRVALSVLALALPSVTICGWAERNRRATGLWTFSTIGAYTLYYYKAAGVVWYRTHESFENVQRSLWQNLGLQLQRWPDTPPEYVKEMKDRGLKIIRSDPTALVTMSAESLIYIAVTPDRSDLQSFFGTKAPAAVTHKPLSKIRERTEELLESPLLTTLVGFSFLSTAFMWTGVGLALKRLNWKSSCDPLFILMPLCASLMVMGLAVGPEAAARFRVPAVPLLAMISGLGWFGRRTVSTGTPPTQTR